MVRRSFLLHHFQVEVHVSNIVLAVSRVEVDSTVVILFAGVSCFIWGLIRRRRKYRLLKRSRKYRWLWRRSLDDRHRTVLVLLLAWCAKLLTRILLARILLVLRINELRILGSHGRSHLTLVHLIWL